MFPQAGHFKNPKLNYMSNEQIEKLEDKLKDILSKSKFDVVDMTNVWSNVGYWIHQKVEAKEAELQNSKKQLPKREE